MKNTVEIHYCPGCKWLARAAWYAQELLTTYSEELDRVALVPSPEAGIFRITLNMTPIMDRTTDGFLEAKVLKRRIRDEIAPQRSLGHIDTADMKASPHQS